MDELSKRIYENQEEYNRLFIELANSFKEDTNKSVMFASTRSSEIDNLLKSINNVRNNLEVLEGVKAYLDAEEKKVYNNG